MIDDSCQIWLKRAQIWLKRAAKQITYFEWNNGIEYLNYPFFFFYQRVE